MFLIKSFEIPLTVASKNLFFFCICIVLFLQTACKKNSPFPEAGTSDTGTCLTVSTPNAPTEQVIFLGHIYDPKHPTVIEDRLEYLARKGYFQQFEHIWLGGDICAETTSESYTLDYLDCLFDLSHPHTHWAVGNHDIRNGNKHFITDKTLRPFFYVSIHDNFVVLVLNSNLYDPDCEDLDTQAMMIHQLCDTIQHASHLLVLSHHIFWSNADAGLQAINMSEKANANKPFWLSECRAGTEFQKTLYPRFKKVQERGIQVVFIAGDYGQKDKLFQYQSEAGIWFLASGIARNYTTYNNQPLPPDHILSLTLNKSQQQLSWQFLNVDSLVNAW